MRKITRLFYTPYLTNCLKKLIYRDSLSVRKSAKTNPVYQGEISAVYRLIFPDSFHVLRQMLSPNLSGTLLFYDTKSIMTPTSAHLKNVIFLFLVKKSTVMLLPSENYGWFTSNPEYAFQIY